MTTLSKSVNFNTLGTSGSLTKQADGTFLAVWAGADGIHARVFSADGEEMGAQFTIKTGAATYTDVSVAALKGANAGKNVITWMEGGVIKKVVLNADRTSTESTVDWGGLITESSPKVHARDDGGYDVFYEGVEDRPDEDMPWYGVHTVRSDGAIDNEMVSPIDIDHAAGMLTNGYGILLYNLVGGGRSRIRVEDAFLGVLYGEIERISEDHAANHSITALAGGAFVVTWQDETAADDDTLVVRAQLFNADKEKQGDVITFEKPAGTILKTVVTQLSDGSFAVLLTMDNAGDKDVYVMTSSADGATVTAPVFVGSSLAGHQTNASIVALEDGSFVVSWTQQDGTDFHFMSEVFSDSVPWVGTEAPDVHEGTDAVDDMDGLGGNDQLLGLGGNDLLKGGQGNDVLGGGDDSDQLYGNDGDDFLDGDAGSDRLEGGAGNDSYFVDDIGDVVIETTDASGGFDIVVVSASSFALSNTVGIEQIEVDPTVTTGVKLIGNNFVNTLIGGQGNDTLDGGGASGGAGERLEGGKGSDLYYVRSLNDVVVEAAGEGLDSVILSSKSYDHSKLANIEIIRYDIAGTAGSDRLDGGAHDDTLKGGDGSDVLNGGAGIDWMIGGTGDDVYYMTPNDVIVEEGGGGRDTIIASFSASLGNNTQVEVLQAMDGVAPLTLGGANMNDTIIGNAGANTIKGGSGNDTLEGRDGADTINGDIGADRLTGGLGTDTLDGGDDADTLYGDVGADSLVGGLGADTLDGGDDADTIVGDVGDDRLVGGLGADTLDGGVGLDVFVFNSAVAKKKNQNIDKIVGFNVKDDAVHLENAIFKKLGNKGSEMKPAQLSKAAFWIGNKAHDANDRIIYDKKKGALLYDEDGTGSKAAIQIAILDRNIKKISEKDFFII